MASFEIGDIVQVQEGDVMHGTVGTVVYFDDGLQQFLVRVGDFQQNYVSAEHLKKIAGIEEDVDEAASEHPTPQPQSEYSIGDVVQIIAEHSALRRLVGVVVHFDAKREKYLVRAGVIQNYYPANEIALYRPKG